MTSAKSGEGGGMMLSPSEFPPSVKKNQEKTSMDVIKKTPDTIFFWKSVIYNYKISLT